MASTTGLRFPFVLLALGLLGLRDFGGGWHWLAVDVLWSIGGGLAIGAVLGALIGKLVLHLRTRHQEAVGLDEFLALGLIAIAYGIAQLTLASGFLAVFAAGLALQRVKEHSRRGAQAGVSKVTMTLGAEGEKAFATHTQPCRGLPDGRRPGFNGQLERLAELVVVLVTGAMLSYVELPDRAVWFLLLLFLWRVRSRSGWGWSGRPACRATSASCSRGSASAASAPSSTSCTRSTTACREPLADELVALTLTTVAASILLHGISVTPLMSLYARRKVRRTIGSGPG